MDKSTYGVRIGQAINLVAKDFEKDGVDPTQQELMFVESVYAMTLFLDSVQQQVIAKIEADKLKQQQTTTEAKTNGFSFPKRM